MSEIAKDFVTKLLNVDPVNRLSAIEALKHPWMQQVIERQAEESKVGAGVAFSNFKSFNSESNLKKAA